MTKLQSRQIIDNLAEFFAKSVRTPILRQPVEYGWLMKMCSFHRLMG